MIEFVVLAVLCQDKVKLDLTYKDGYHYRVTKRQSEESDVTIKHDDDPPVRNRSRGSSEHVYTETVLGTENGLPIRVERTYTRAHDEFEDLEKKTSKSRDLTFVDKKVTISRSEKGSAVEEYPRGISARDLQQLQIRLDPITTSFPSAAMAPGDDWTLPEAGLRQEFLRQLPGFTIESAKGEAKLARVETWNKQRCAVVTAAVELEARSPMGPSVSIRTDATLWLNLERGIVVRVDAESRQTLGGSVDHKVHGRFGYDGTSTSKYGEEIVWLD